MISSESKSIENAISYVHGEFPKNLDSEILSLRILGMRIGLTVNGFAIEGSMREVHLCFLIEGVSPRGPHRDKHLGHFSSGALLCLTDVGFDQTNFGSSEAGRPPPDPPRAPRSLARALLGKGQMGSALMGSLQISCLLTEGLFGHSR